MSDIQIMIENGLPMEGNSDPAQKALAALTDDLERVLAAARPRLLRLAQRYGVSPDAADDVVQEALLEAWRRIMPSSISDSLYTSFTVWR